METKFNELDEIGFINLLVAMKKAPTQKQLTIISDLELILE